MLDAALDSFVQSGYHGATMAAIAKRAAVAEPTMYFTFHSKAELLQEVLAHVSATADEPAMIERRPWFLAILDEPDARRMVALVVEHGTNVLQSLAPLEPTMRQAAAIDPAAAGVFADIDHRRREAFTRIVTAAGLRAPLALPIPRAVDIIDVVQSAPTFNAYRARGWQLVEFKAWSFHVLTECLLPLPTRAATRAADAAATVGVTFSDLVERDGQAAAT
ncbi:hypothetical protein GCM10017690_02860 [Microbacterium terregens]